MRTCFLLGVLVAAGLFTVGCSGRNGEVTVAGQVTFDGKPLPSGVITFTPEDGRGASDGVKIVDGAYRIGLGPGKKRVSIVAERPAGQIERVKGKPEHGTFDVVQQYLPARYNTASKLSLTVPGDTGNFELTSQK